MGKEDLLLRVEMGKLEIEPLKMHKNVKVNNPFIISSNNKSHCPRSQIKTQKCYCSPRKVHNKNLIISKRKSNQILKEPVLKQLQTHCKTSTGTEKLQMAVNIHRISPLNRDVLNLCALVDNCNQLRISTDAKKKCSGDSEISHKKKWWKNDIYVQPIKSSVMEKPQAGSCSQQALNPPCDITIDELASYFETLVHIPKKMSSMAEMMYI